MNQFEEFLLSLSSDKNKEPKDIIRKIYAISNNVENNYNVFYIKKRNGKLRTIYEPNYNLKLIQKNILHNVLEEKVIADSAKAYHKNISLRENALIHQNKKVVLKLDICDFFSSITFSQVLNCFSEYPYNIKVLLTKLCTYYDFLPQGAPTSSYISNLVMRNFDLEVEKLCQEKNISYTRYSDDLTFSGDFDYKEFIKIINGLLISRGFLMNRDKIIVASQKTRQVVTGIVVNKKLQTSIEYRKKIRQEMYYIKKFGLNFHIERLEINNKEKYLNSLKGRINYCLQINPDDKEMKKYRDYITEI